MKKRNEKNSSLAVSIYVLAMRKQIEEELESKYSKRIDHLIAANNELARELEKSEKELVRMTAIADSILLNPDNSIKKLKDRYPNKVFSDGRGGLYTGS